MANNGQRFFPHNALRLVPSEIDFWRDSYRAQAGRCEADAERFTAMAVKASKVGNAQFAASLEKRAFDAKRLAADFRVRAASDTLRE